MYAPQFKARVDLMKDYEIFNRSNFKKLAEDSQFPIIKKIKYLFMVLFLTVISQTASQV